MTMGYVQKDWDYRRVCDLCGRTANASEMRKVENMRVCNVHDGQRMIQELDRLNANFRVPPEMPVPDPKPQNFLYPNTFIDDESALFSFVETQVLVTRYPQGTVNDNGNLIGMPLQAVTSGDGAPVYDIAPKLSSLVVGDGVNGVFAWGARYFYDLLIEGSRPESMLTRARSLLKVCADELRARQIGIVVRTDKTFATSGLYGGLFNPYSNLIWSDNMGAAGLAFLYAYRVFGEVQYIESARAAASFLRNVQGTCQHATIFPSQDSAGTQRLVCDGVSRLTAIQFGGGWQVDGMFFPSSAIVLEFWKELMATDGDQTIGATAAVSGFDTAPAQLLSTSIAGLRAFLTNGVTDATGETYTGLSVATPREFFNAYPADKFTPGLEGGPLVGTGRWEFSDGGAATGTTVSSQNFGQALSSLYAYEGASAQVTAIDDWMRSFSSNPAYETPDGTSEYALARSLTGEYDPKEAPATQLLVRDSTNGYAATAMNGSSRYDWGALGLLAKLWNARHRTSFQAKFVGALGPRQRVHDGRPSDGLTFDRIYKRGQSGLSHQTYFTDTVGTWFDSPGPHPFPVFTAITASVNDAIRAAQFGRVFREVAS